MSAQWKTLLDPLQWYIVLEIKEEALLAVHWALRQLCPVWMDIFYGSLRECLCHPPSDAWGIKK
jgi:hypothetical protein